MFSSAVKIQRRYSWAEAAQRWLKETDHKAEHARDVEKIAWLHQYLGDLWLDEITRDIVSEIAETKRKVAAPATVNRYIAVVRAVLRMARDEWDWIERVPRLRFYHEPKKRIRWLTQQDAVRLVKELPSHLSEMALFTLATGLRQRNVSYLKWEQVDLQRRMAWIHPDQSKSRRAITVPLNDDAMTVLLRHRGAHPIYVFTYRGRPVDRTTTKAWHKALNRAGIANFRWHDLRHTWASWHVQHGTTLNELMELGGWSCYEMVLRYAHFAGEHLRQASRQIEGVLD